jgi:hypothetical protein
MHACVTIVRMHHLDAQSDRCNRPVGHLSGGDFCASRKLMHPLFTLQHSCRAHLADFAISPAPRRTTDLHTHSASFPAGFLAVMGSGVALSGVGHLHSLSVQRVRSSPISQQVNASLHASHALQLLHALLTHLSPWILLSPSYLSQTLTLSARDVVPWRILAQRVGTTPYQGQPASPYPPASLVE